MTMAAKPQNPCDDHPMKELIFMCMQCSKLICNRCKKADHEGHKTKDISKVSAETRHLYKNNKEEQERLIQQVEQTRAFHMKRLEDFDRSVEQVKNEVRFRQELVRKWLQKHVDKKITVINRLAKKHGRLEIVQDMENTEQVLQGLKNKLKATGEILKKGASDHEIARLSGQLTEAAISSNDDMVAKVLEKRPKISNYVFFPATSFAIWKSGLRDFIGTPKAAQYSADCKMRGLALTHVLTCSENAQAEVLGLLPDSQGRLIVVIDTENHSKAKLKLYGANGEKVHEEFTEPRPRKCQIGVLPGNIFVVCTQSGTIIEHKSKTDQVTNFISEFMVNRSVSALDKRLFTLKNKTISEGKHRLSLAKTKKDQHKLFEVTGLPVKSVAICTLHAENPQTVVADSTGTLFAVIKHRIFSNIVSLPENELSKRQSLSNLSNLTSEAMAEIPKAAVVIFKKVDSAKTAELVENSFFSAVPDHDDFLPSSICFYENAMKKEVLLIADTASNAIYEADSSSAQRSLHPFITDCPLLGTPLILATEPRDRLWIGCQGGRILKLLPKDEVIEDEYLVPKDPHDSDSSDYEDYDGVDVVRKFKPSSASAAHENTNSPPEIEGSKDVKNQRPFRQRIYDVIDISDLGGTPEFADVNSAEGTKRPERNNVQMPVGGKEQTAIYAVSEVPPLAPTRHSYSQNSSALSPDSSRPSSSASSSLSMASDHASGESATVQQAVSPKTETARTQAAQKPPVLPKTNQNTKYFVRESKQ